MDTIVINGETFVLEWKSSSLTKEQVTAQLRSYLQLDYFFSYTRYFDGFLI